MSKGDHWPALRLALFIGAVAWVALYGVPGFSMSSAPPYPPAFGGDLSCDNGTVANGYRLVTCWSPVGSDNVPPQAWVPYPSGWALPEPYKQQCTPLRLKLHYHGWEPHSLGGINAGFADPCHISVESVYGHYPDATLWGAVMGLPGGMQPVDGGGPFNGTNSNLERMVETLDEIAARGLQVDMARGYASTGNCYGGTASFLTVVALPDRHRNKFSVIDVVLPALNFVNTDPEGGLYWRDARVQAAWAGYPLAGFDWTQNLSRINHLYIHVNGSSYPADNVGTSRNFYRWVCDAGKIACYGVWGKQGHALPDPLASPAYQALAAARYTGPEMEARLDTLLPVFTKSTANYWGERGHYNLGLEWRNAGIVDTPERVVVPIRYRRRTADFFGAGIPDQPESATFDLTLRRTHLERDKLYRWEIGEQSGYLLGGDAPTIPGVTLESGENYTDVIITRETSYGC